MKSVIIFGVTLLGFRLIALAGVTRLRTWSSSAAYALGAMLLFTASAHFVPSSVTEIPNHDDLARMVPSFVPSPSLVVYVTGVAEVLGAIGLFVASMRRVTGFCLAALFVFMLPANIYAAVEDIPFNGEAPAPLWLRVPMQALYIGIAVWVAQASAVPSQQRVLTAH
jgi:uncharacterized membrane protein